MRAQRGLPAIEDDSPPARLFDSEFMSSYTEFSSLYQFLVQSPWEVLSIAELEKIPANPRDAYIAEHTAFADFGEMRWVAHTEWVDRLLNR